jgi:hypothetical protein
MSAEVMQMLADRWNCSVQEVRERLVERLRDGGVVSKEAATIKGDDGDGGPYARRLILGVTDDDRVALLDDDDAVICWVE